MQGYASGLRFGAVLEQIDRLPCAEGWRAVLDRDRQAGLGQGGLDVGGHVVGAFGVMTVAAGLGGDPAEEVEQIGADIRIGVFLDD